MGGSNARAPRQIDYGAAASALGARADFELRDAQDVLNPDSAEKSERDLALDVAPARRAVTSALEKVRARLGVGGPQKPPEPQQRPWWRRMFGG